MTEIVLATRNRHKVRELKVLLTVRGVRWRSLADFPDMPDVKEHGRTFLTNATLKARAVARHTGCLALADDSGLEVAALRGAPGVQSARFAGRHGDDAANNAKVLRLLRGQPTPQRRAQFVCVLALASPTRVLAITRGMLRGRIAEQPAGRGGFGYDPIVRVPRFKETVAQLPAATKNRISHRAEAARRMRHRLPPLLKRLPQ